MQCFKIFGERNTGTNLVRTLVADDRFWADDAGLTEAGWLNETALLIGRVVPGWYDALYDRVTVKRHAAILGWKHAFPAADQLLAYRTRPIVVVKHPSFWMRSLESNPFHIKLGATYRPRRIENAPLARYELEDLLLAKYAAYIDCAMQCSGIVIQYESLISEFGSAKKRLRKIFGECRDIPEKDVRPFVTHDRGNYTTQYNNECLSTLNNFDRRRLADAGDILSFFGYQKSGWNTLLPFSL